MTAVVEVAEVPEEPWRSERAAGVAAVTEDAWQR